jgi:hypothetical protein
MEKEWFLERNIEAEEGNAKVASYVISLKSNPNHQMVRYGLKKLQWLLLQNNSIDLPSFGIL